MSDLVQIVTVVCSLVGTLATLGVGAMLTWMKMSADEKERIRLEEKKASDNLAVAQRSADEKKDAAIAEAVKEVAIKVDSTQVTTDQKLDTIHTLVNSNMAQQLKISSVALRRVADLTAHPDDISAAKVAEEALAEHEKKQKIVDDQERANDNSREIPL